jgi:heme-degrading monooxygenase HmoA
VFTVHKGKEEEFVKWWEDIRADITKRPGFISGKFYRSLKPDSRFNFINVAIWENEELYWKAFERSVTHEKLKQLTAEMTPALYNVAVEY